MQISERKPETTPPFVEVGIRMEPSIKYCAKVLPVYRRVIMHAIPRSVKRNNLIFFRVKCDIRKNLSPAYNQYTL